MYARGGLLARLLLCYRCGGNRGEHQNLLLELMKRVERHLTLTSTRESGLQSEECAQTIDATHHDGRGAVQQRAVGDVRVAGDPANVGRAPVDVLRVEVERVPERGGHVQQVAGGGVQHTLRLARGAAVGRAESGERVSPASAIGAVTADRG